MTELEQTIIALLADETGTARASLLLSSRLAQDLGMDGDDALDFFESFGERFRVDLAILRDHWLDHFRPEGFWSQGPGFWVIEITVRDLADSAAAGKWIKRYPVPEVDLFRTFG